jgi:hypothetical protein
LSRKPKLDAEQMKKVLFLYHETTCSIARIARHLGASPCTITKIIEGKYVARQTVKPSSSIPVALGGLRNMEGEKLCIGIEEEGSALLQDMAEFATTVRTLVNFPCRSPQ